MTVDRELFDSLREGDVVRFRKEHWPFESFSEGPIRQSSMGGDALFCCDSYLNFNQLEELEILKRAWKPFYKNALRERPVVGDVAVMESNWLPWLFTFEGWVSIWRGVANSVAFSDNAILIFDGETKRVVS